jgi:hypothetical protein
MGIKKDRLLRLGQKLLPLKVKKLLVKHKIVKGIDDTRTLVYDDYDVVEFWLPGFNDAGLVEPFKHIMCLYDTYLKDDPYWHFIYEGDYALIRCSYMYAKDLEKYFAEHNIEHKPIEWWRESTHVTALYKDVFKEIFHWTSVLAIEMAKNEEKDFYISQSADRIVHIFLLQAIYLADINGDLDRFRKIGYGIQYWEADHMADLAKFRAYNIGKIDGHNQLQDRWKKMYEKKEDV